MFLSALKALNYLTAAIIDYLTDQKIDTFTTQSAQPGVSHKLTIVWEAIFIWRLATKYQCLNCARFLIIAGDQDATLLFRAKPCSRTLDPLGIVPKTRSDNLTAAQHSQAVCGKNHVEAGGLVYSKTSRVEYRKKLANIGAGDCHDRLVSSLKSYENFATSGYVMVSCSIKGCYTEYIVLGYISDVPLVVYRHPLIKAICIGAMSPYHCPNVFLPKSDSVSVGLQGANPKHYIRNYIAPLDAIENLSLIGPFMSTINGTASDVSVYAKPTMTKTGELEPLVGEGANDKILKAIGNVGEVPDFDLITLQKLCPKIKEQRNTFYDTVCTHLFGDKYVMLDNMVEIPSSIAFDRGHNRELSETVLKISGILDGRFYIGFEPNNLSPSLNIVPRMSGGGDGLSPPIWTWQQMGYNNCRNAINQFLSGTQPPLARVSIAPNVLVSQAPLIGSPNVFSKIDTRPLWMHNRFESYPGYFVPANDCSCGFVGDKHNCELPTEAPKPWRELVDPNMVKRVAKLIPKDIQGSAHVKLGLVFQRIIDHGDRIGTYVMVNMNDNDPAPFIAKMCGFGGVPNIEIIMNRVRRLWSKTKITSITLSDGTKIAHFI